MPLTIPWDGLLWARGGSTDSRRRQPGHPALAELAARSRQAPAADPTGLLDLRRLHLGYEPEFGLVSTMRPLVLLDRSPLAGPLLVGLSLMIHFGAFDVVAGGWRWRGVGCQRLFRADRPRRLDRPRLDAGLAAGSPADLVPSAVPGRCGLAPRRGERVSQSFHRHAQVQAIKDMTNMTREWGW